MNNAIQIISGIVVLLVIAVGGYLFYSQSNGQGISGIASGITGATLATSTLDADQDQTLQRLNELQDITIDTEFLSSDAFVSLENFGITIEPQPVGRSNPFESADVVEPADVTESSMDIDLTEGESSQQDSEDSQSTTSQSTTSVDQLLDVGDTAPERDTSTPDSPSTSSTNNGGSGQ